jgi:hypothetical protein
MQTIALSATTIASIFGTALLALAVAAGQGWL